MNYFRGCTALITGASAGIGREIARQLAPVAHALVLVARRLDRLDALRNELLLQHPNLNVHTYGLDIADEAAVDTFMAWLRGNGLRVNFLVNNAGLGDHGPFATADWSRTRRIIEVNVTALTRLTHLLLPMLRESAHAAILNTSSIAGMMPVPNMAVYAATKAYVSSFTEALRAELRHTGMTVAHLCPGPVETEFGDVARRESGESLPAPDFMKVPAGQVAAEALAAVARDRARIIPGLLPAVLATLAAALPLVLLRILLNRRAAH